MLQTLLVVAKRLLRLPEDAPVHNFMNKAAAMENTDAHSSHSQTGVCENGACTKNVGQVPTLLLNQNYCAGKGNA